MNDIRRRIRAIEVYKKTGIPFSAQENRREPSPYRWIIVCICPEREKLYERINSRTEKMISQGLPDEVASLLKEGVPENAQSMQAIGYKEMVPYLSGKCTLPEASELIRKRTRHYAKRQITFLKRIENIQYVDPLKKGAYEEIKNRMKENA
jgi:tRNA dimethylallyltransferase